MVPRRSFRLIAGALVLALPLLSGCGFGKATDKVYTPGAGVNDRGGDVKVLSAVVVAAQPDSGTFVATFSNNGKDEASLDSLTGTDEAEGLEIDTVAPVDIPVRGYLNLADDGGIPVRGEFEAGRTLALTLTFSSGATVELDVPVVYACDEYTGLDFSASDPSADVESTPTTDPSAEPTTEGSALPSEEASAEASPVESYDCATALEEE